MSTPNLAAPQTVTPKVLASTQIATTAATTVYTVPANTSAKIAHGVLCNTGGAAVTVSVSLVPSGGTADGTHRVISGYSLAAGDSLPLADYLAGAMLGAGDFVSVTCSIGAVVDVVLTGTEHT